MTLGYAMPTVEDIALLVISSRVQQPENYWMFSVYTGTCKKHRSAEKMNEEVGTIQKEASQ